MRLLLSQCNESRQAAGQHKPIYMHACIHTYTRVDQLRDSINLCTYIHAYIHSYIHSYTRVDRLLDSINLYTCIHAFIHTYIHESRPAVDSINLHAYMHTYIHACIHTRESTSCGQHKPTCIHAYIHTRESTGCGTASTSRSRDDADEAPARRSSRHAPSSRSRALSQWDVCCDGEAIGAGSEKGRCKAI
jgi:hypothetical protein